MGMLMKYLRDDARRRVGVVVALDKNRIGWSILHDLDMEWKAPNNIYGNYDNDKAIGIAVRRAERGYSYWVEDFKGKVEERFGESSPDFNLVIRAFPKLVMVMDEVVSMKKRADKYFKENPNGN